MAFTATTLDGLMKRLYKGQTVANLGLDSAARPFYTDLTKRTDFGGTVYPQPIIYSNGGSVGSVFGTVQTNARSSYSKQFLIDVATQYGVANITSDAIDRAKGDLTAFVDGLKHMNDGVIATMYDRLEQQLFSPADGHIGVVGSAGVTSNAFTLATIQDAAKFYVGMVIHAAASASASIRTNSAKITNVNVNTGEITMDSTPTSMAAGDLIFIAADYATAGDEKCVKGLPDWLPSSIASSGDSFFGVNRYADAARLGGTYVSGSTSDIEGSIKDACRKVARMYGRSPTHGYLSHDNFAKLLNEVDSRVQRSDGKRATVIGTAELEMFAGSGIIKLRPSTHCSETDIYLLRLEDWYLMSMGEPVRIIMHDGLRVRAAATADTFEVRYTSRPQLVCKAPGRSARLALS